jgi:hypothetical protein
MFPRLAASACLLFFAAATAFAADVPLQTFRADYQVLRDGKELGHATLALQPAGDGTWEFSNQTQGTKGMASMLGLDVVEKSTFRWRDGLPEGLHYSYAQQSAIKSRQRSTDFDWNSRQARSRDGKHDYIAPLQSGAMDRNLVTVALMSALKSGTRDLDFRVVDKDKLSDQHYAVSGRETLALPAGKIEAVRVDRQRENSQRATTSWFAPQRGFLPVQIEQVEKNGETITLRLVEPKSR